MTYTISNLAGGDKRSFRLNRDGRISDASIRHARKVAMGPVFGGPAADVASDQYFELMEQESC